MPNLREFSAPSGIGLQPTEMGIDAVTSAARREGAFYNQAGEAMTDTGRRAASAIQEVSDTAIKYEDHREISAGAASIAQIQSNLTDQWNQTAKTADPNDPSVAAKFRAEVVDPALEKFQGGFNTDASQRFAEQKIDALRQHMFEFTTSTMGNLARKAVDKNIGDLTTSSSNTAMLDPTSVPNLLAGLKHSVDAVVGANPNLSATDAASVTGEVSSVARRSIIHSGAIGAIQKSSNPEATADEWIRKYPDDISGADAKALAGNARQQIRANNSDLEQNRRRQKEVAQDQSNEATNGYLIAVRSQDPKLANDPTAKTILNDPTLTKTDKNNLLNYIDRQLKPETDTRLSQQTFVGLLRDLRNPDANPDEVMQKAWDARLMDPGKAGSMSEKDFNQFRQEVVARKTPEGAALETDRAAFFKNYANTIAGPTANYTPQLGDPKVYNAEMDARRVEADLKKKGLDPHLAYDPSSQYFLGKPDRLAKWQSSLQQDLQTRAAAPASTNLTAGNSQITGMETKDLAIVRNADDYAKLPSGASYTDPNGKLRTKR